MVVCPRCKAENDDGRIRCGKCGNNISSRGDYTRSAGPKVVVLGSVEDLKRAREQGEIDTSDDDPDALGWLSSEELDDVPAHDANAPATRRVSVKEIDKISGLKDLHDIQKALVEAETQQRATPPPAPAHPSAPPTAPPPTEPRRATIGARAKTTSERMTPVPRPTADADTATTAYLSGELFPDPFALSPARKYLIGRDPRASIYLPSGEVSRRHAGIAADEKGQFWIEDLRSYNGTYVNGHAILKRRLRPGDFLDVGPFAFRFVTAGPNIPPPDARTDPNAETRAIRAVPGVLVGDIEKNGVLALLRLLHDAKRSGVITLRAGPQVGRIFLIGGDVHHAQFGKTLGEQALAALLPAEAGFVHFTDEKIRVNRTVERSMADILGLDG